MVRGAQSRAARGHGRRRKGRARPILWRASNPGPTSAYRAASCTAARCRRCGRRRKRHVSSRSRARAAQSEAEARLPAAARLAGRPARIRMVVEQRLALIQAAEEIETTYREGLLPQGQAGGRSAAARYAAGQGTQAGVLDAMSAILEDRIDYLRLLATHGSSAHGSTRPAWSRQPGSTRSSLTAAVGCRGKPCPRPLPAVRRPRKRRPPTP